ncbi:MAG TPA: hypothetical protein VK989_03955 [Polyangia bacterium]|jgi:hypothetical protein|nr:hypothetical protein [Polyangia bacterium]
MRRAGALLALALAACGSSAATKADASADGARAADATVDARGDDSTADAVDGGAAEALPAGFRAYDVTATLTRAPSSTPSGGDFSSFPTTVPFTLVWDPGTQQVATGAHGRFAQTRVITTDNRTFRSGTLGAGVPFAPSCTGVGGVSLDEASFTLEGATLRGTASADETYATNAGSFTTVEGTAMFTGVPDVTPPELTSPGTSVDPLAPVILPSSEPLPAAVAASLVGSPSGDTVALSGMRFSVASDARTGLETNGQVLRYGETYTMAAGQVVDYAGNKATAPVSFTTRAAPPLVPADGFESVTGTTFAGAGVLHGGPLMPIAGATSLLLNTGYGGGFGFLPYDLGSSLAVRLAVPPGATKVSFDAQLIAPDPVDSAAFVGAIRFGSVGGTVSTQENVKGSGFVEETLPALGDIYVSPVQTITLALPADATAEIAFEIVGEIDLCAEPPSPTVLVVDDLRVE